MTWTAGHLNCHNNRKALALAVGWKTKTLSLNEVGKIAGAVDAVRGMDSFSVPGAKVPARSSLSTRVLFDADLTTTAGFGVLAADWAKPEKLAPGRWLYGVGFGNDIMAMSFHNHAAQDDRRLKIKRVRQAARGIKVIRDVWEMYEDFGYANYLMGDLNTRDEANSPGWKDAGEMFRDMGLEYEQIGLDWVVWNPQTLGLKDLNVITREEHGNVTDHPGLLAKFDRR